ncbi:MAG: HAD-IIB family hydrolase [Candidatus Aenigmarchaeota archaeon]|nr:HAD-IIB family hydrolase [Candidatus Aenigmarchaeota archaeon]
MNSTCAKTIVFSDLDGTLLDHYTYSYKDSLKGINLLKEKKIPLIICTSWTFAQMEKFMKSANLNNPFIMEDGGAIYIPKDFFDFKYHFDKQKGKYNIIELGTPIKKITLVLNEIKNKYSITTFSDMTIEELSKDANFSPKSAKLAKMREYDEAFKINKKGETEKIIEMIEQKGYLCTNGARYYHIMKNNDKGKAVKILTALFKRKYKNIRTIGLGDSKNDIAMLKEVDVPVIVRNSARLRIKDFDAITTKHEGPKGWMEAVLKFALNKA